MTGRHNILFVHYGDNWIRGSERCLLDHLTHIDNRRFRPYVWTNSKALHEEVKRLGFHSEHADFPLLFGWHAPRFNLAAWFRLIKMGYSYVKHWQIDLIHVNSAAPCQWMNLIARLTNTPLVTQIHTDYQARDRFTLGLHFSPRIIAVSHAITESLIRDGYPQQRISVIHNGVDTARLERFDPIDIHQQFQLPKDASIFITVGSLIKRKGIDRILSALRHLVLEYPQAHLVIVGNGPLRKNLEHMVDHLKLTQYVHFAGEQPNPMSWLRAADTFISGARNEPFGLVITEAALAELPIVAPHTGGIPEIISHKRHGLLFNNKGIKPMVEMMRTALKNPKSMKKMAQHAKAHIQKNYTIDHNTQAIENLYEEIIAAKHIPYFSWFAAFRPIKTYFLKRLSIGG